VGNLLKRTLVLMVFVWMWAVTGVANAQTSNGTIVGTVTDRSGAVVPGADVTVTSAQYGNEHKATTDSTGGYHAEALPPGRYTVTINAAGFDTLTISNVDVQASLTVTANGTLEVSAVKHTVLVEATAGQELQTESGELSHDISQEEVRNLPFFSLNPVELVLTEPGVQDSTNQFGFSNGQNFSVDGTRPRANNFLIDGQDNNDNGINGQAFQTTNYGLVQEVTILTNAYSAEYGRGGGSVTNEITRRGSNEFHGEAWELNRNSAFAGIPAQDTTAGPENTPTKNPYDNENTFGFDIGGPIKHNKLFVFGTAQWDREHQAATGDTLEVPTASGIATLNSLAATHPNAAILVQALGGVVGSGTGFPVQLGPGLPAVNVNFFQRFPTSVGLDRQWATRLDWNFSPNDMLSGIYRRDDGSLTPDFFNAPFTLPLFDEMQFGASQALTGVWTHTFSPALVNEFRFSYSNIGFTFGFTNEATSSPLANMPNLAFGGTFGQGVFEIGLNQGNPQGRGHKSYQYQDAISMTMGRHAFKFGGDIDYVQVDDLVPFDSRGSITFDDGGGFSDLGNFVDNATGTGGSVSKVFGNPEVQPLETIYAPYVQDTWHIKSNLTMDLGLRYEYWGVPGNVAQYPSINLHYITFGLRGATFPGVAASKEKADENNFAPRVGIAYTPGFWKGVFGENKSVLRAGWGMFYDGLFSNIIDNTIATSPNATGVSAVGVSGQGVLNATGVLASAAPVPSPFAAIETIDSHLLNPLTHQWNVDIEREVPGNFVITAAYVGTRGEHLYANQDLNEVDPLTGIRVNPNFGPVTLRDNAGDSIYHSGQLKVERRFSRGFLVRGAYTYSKFIDDTSEVFVTTGLSSYSQNVLCQACDRGLSSYDRRHRGVMTWVWDVPGTRMHDNLAESALSYVTSGWQWSGTATIQTGSPEVIHDGFDANGDGHSQDRPSIGNASLPQTSRGIDGVFLGLTGTPGTYFDIETCFVLGTACNPQPASAFHYIITTSPTGGTVGRNTFIGPGQWFFNTSVQRSFKIPVWHMEQSRLTFRTEFFNAFNHPNQYTDALGFFPDVTDMLSGDFLNLGKTVQGGRQIRFWLKYQF
jgi:outer membrane receptor protein involved in Fe transport